LEQSPSRQAINPFVGGATAGDLLTVPRPQFPPAIPTSSPTLSFTLSPPPPRNRNRNRNPPHLINSQPSTIWRVLFGFSACYGALTVERSSHDRHEYTPKRMRRHTLLSIIALSLAAGGAGGYLLRAQKMDGSMVLSLKDAVQEDYLASQDSFSRVRNTRNTLDAQSARYGIEIMDAL